MSSPPPSPQRPAIDATPPPTVDLTPAVPRALRVSTAIWQIALIAALSASVYVFLNRGATADFLAGRILQRRQTDRGHSASDVAQAATTLVIAAIAATVIIQAVLLLLLWQRRRGARAGLLLAGIAGIAVNLAGYSIATGRAPADWPADRIASLAATGLTLVATLSLLASSITAWARRRR